MRLLLDTAILIYAVESPERLSRPRTSGTVAALPMERRNASSSRTVLGSATSSHSSSTASSQPKPRQSSGVGPGLAASR